MDKNYKNEQNTKQLSLNFDSATNKTTSATIIDINNVRINRKSSCKKAVAISAILKEAQSLTW